MPPEDEHDEKSSSPKDGAGQGGGSSSVGVRKAPPNVAKEAVEKARAEEVELEDLILKKREEAQRGKPSGAAAAAKQVTKSGCSHTYSVLRWVANEWA